MDSLPFDEWVELFHEMYDQILHDKWKASKSKETFDDYKKRVQIMAQNGIDQAEFDRIQRLANV